MDCKIDDWVSVQPTTSTGKMNGPRVNGMVRRINRKGIFVEHVPGTVSPSLYRNPRSVTKPFPATTVQKTVSLV